MTITLERTSWQRVCEFDDLEPAFGEAALLGSTQLALVRYDDAAVFAVDHLDPRTGSPVMARGIVGSRGGRPTIASPLHKEVYDLGTGECLTDPSLALRVYRTRIVSGSVQVEFEA